MLQRFKPKKQNTFFKFFSIKSSFFKKHNSIKPFNKENENEKVLYILKAFNNFNTMNSNSLDYYYNKALNSIKSLEYTSVDVQKFCFELKNFENQADDFKVKAGLFLSALINQSKEQKFLLDTTALSSKIHYLGYSNTKEIVVNGNVGNNLGSNMEKGKITVYGNAGTNVGYLMKGGEIYIEGQYQSIYPYLLGKVYHKNQLIFKDGKKLNDLANQKK